jgi:hypothetical protein
MHVIGDDAVSQQMILAAVVVIQVAADHGGDPRLRQPVNLAIAIEIAVVGGEEQFVSALVVLGRGEPFRPVLDASVSLGAEPVQDFRRDGVGESVGNEMNGPGNVPVR